MSDRIYTMKTAKPNETNITIEVTGYVGLPLTCLLSKTHRSQLLISTLTRYIKSTGKCRP